MPIKRGNFLLYTHSIKNLTTKKMSKNCSKVAASKMSKFKKKAYVAVHPSTRGVGGGRRSNGLPGTLEYEDEAAFKARLRAQGLYGVEDEELPAPITLEDELACIFCNREARTFAELAHHVGIYHKVGYQQFRRIAEDYYRALQRPIKVEEEPISTEPVLTRVPRLPAGHGGCECHPQFGVADPVDKPRDVYGQFVSGQRYVYHDLDGTSYVRRSMSRRVQWGAIPRCVFEVRTPGEVPQYLVGHRWGGWYTSMLPEECAPPGHPVGL